MSDKPSYLGLLNAIAVGEKHGYDFLSCWAETTSDLQLAEVLRFVAVREYEHSAAFTKRMCELGYNVKPAAEATFEKRMTLAQCTESSDKKKFRKLLGIGKNASKRSDERAPDPFAKLFDDTTIDPQTGALLGRYIAEERDSGRRLQDAYRSLGDVPPATGDQDLASIRNRLDKLTQSLEALSQSRAG